jgi:excisionase family DNA binding protein
VTDSQRQTTAGRRANNLLDATSADEASSVTYRPPLGADIAYRAREPGTAFSQAPGVHEIDLRPTVTRDNMAVNGERGRNYAAGQQVPPQGQYWDLDLLTPDDVCVLLKVKKSWLYDAVENGAIEAIRLGKQLRFRPSALVRYLEEHISNLNG